MKKIEEDFSDLKLNATRTSINFKNTEVNQAEERKCQILDFNFINTGEDLIQDLEINLKLTDSCIFYLFYSKFF
jgi:hypothetical protein